MSNDPKAPKGQYGEVVARLQAIVDGLERGELSLEESLERFAEGVQLVKQGERLLADAEKKIEQLLSEEGRAVPLKLPEETSAPTAPVAPPRAQPRKPAPPPALNDDDDVPF